jgi:phosphate transport system protein
MPRAEYREQLETLRNDVVEMGELVLDRYDMALAARSQGDPDLAATVREGDREINEQYLALERDCIDLFALQQPVATDLRFVASSFKIVTDLERIGDLATNLAAAPDTGAPERFATVDVDGIATDARDMVADSLAAYATDDAAACWEIAERDDVLDGACEAAAEGVVTHLVRAQPTDDVDALLAAASDLLVTIRDLERVGDHAVNIAARTLYMIDHDDSLLF